MPYKKSGEVERGAKAIKGMSARGVLNGGRKPASTPAKSSGPTAAEMAAKSEAERARLSDAADKKRIAKEKAEAAKAKADTVAKETVKAKVKAMTEDKYQELLAAYKRGTLGFRDKKLFMPEYHRRQKGT